MMIIVAMLYNWIWERDDTPRRRREGVVDLLKKENKVDLGNCRGTTSLSTVGKIFYKMLNDRVETMLEKEGKTANSNRFQTEA